MVASCTKQLVFLCLGDIMRKKIILSIISIILTSFCLVTLTYSWFAFNDTVQTTGMTISVKDVESLVIAKSEQDLSNLSVDNKQFSVNFSTDYDEMIATTHSSESATFLKYTGNTYDVDMNTGLAKNGKEINLLDAPASDQYFFDSIIYLAAIQEEMAGFKLLASITNTTTIQVHYAASVDFYLDEVSNDNFKGTLNLAGKDAFINNGTATKTSVEIIDGSSSGQDKIPLNTEGHIKVIMRFYFDGALLENENKTYINTYQISTEQVALNVDFGLEKLN